MPLSAEQYDSIARRYSERRFRNQSILDARIAEVHKKVPAIRDIENEMAALSLSEAKKRLAGSSEPSQFSERLTVLAAKKQRLLFEGGYPEDYLDPLYDCPICRDTGYVNGKKCQCFRQASAELLYQRAGLSEILKKENFDSFSFDYYAPDVYDPKSGRSARDVIRDVYKICREFVSNFDTDYQNILFFGKPGVGKTFLSNCIAKELLDSGHTVIYASANELFDRLAAQRFSSSREDPVSRLSELLGCDLLIIDDLGTELTNSFVISELFTCVNTRIVQRRSTIISTNLELDKLAETYSERTFSRMLSNYRLVKIIGSDIRIQKQLQKTRSALQNQ